MHKTTTSFLLWLVQLIQKYIILEVYKMFNTSKIIRKLMIDRDISVTPLARKIGITQQNLSRKLNNVNESYTLEYLENIVN